MEPPPPPATYPTTVGGDVARALDEDARAMAQRNGRSSLGARLKALPTEKASDGRVRGIDASADRALLDAAFARWWLEVRRIPERDWEEFVHRHGEDSVDRKTGTYEQGRARGIELYPKPFVTRITTAGETRVASQYAEVNVTRGTRAMWAAPKNNLIVSGRVDLPEDVEVAAVHSLGAQLEGTVGELRLTAVFNAPPKADLVGLWAGLVVPKTPQSVLRIGPDVAAVRYDSFARNDQPSGSVLLIRGGKEVVIPKAPGIPNDSVVLTVIRY